MSVGAGRWAFQTVKASWEVRDSFDHVRGLGRSAVVGSSRVVRGIGGLARQSAASGGRHAAVIAGEIPDAQKDVRTTAQALWIFVKGVVYVVTALAGFVTLYALYREIAAARAIQGIPIP